MLQIRKKVLAAMVADCLDGYPLEACGLLTGVGTEVNAVYPAPNLAKSARVYELDPRVMLKAEREAEASGAEILGVYHSHTHTDAKPSPTDIGQAPDPDWHYVLVSLRDIHPSIRSWHIEDGKIEEEPVVLQW